MVIQKGKGNKKLCISCVNVASGWLDWDGSLECFRVSCEDSCRTEKAGLDREAVITSHFQGEYAKSSGWWLDGAWL